ncbi:MAG: type II toxin-antitoxin system RelE family toxin [Gammaproteobacteria bacterium]
MHRGEGSARGEEVDKGGTKVRLGALGGPRAQPATPDTPRGAIAAEPLVNLRSPLTEFYWPIVARDAARQLEKVPRDYQTVLRNKLGEMAEDPFRGDVVPLKGTKWQGRYRKRVGRYRIIFIPHQNEGAIDVVAILVRDEKGVPVKLSERNLVRMVYCFRRKFSEEIKI